MTIKLHKYERMMDELRTNEMFYDGDLRDEWENYYDDQVDYIRGVCGRNMVDECFEELGVVNERSLWDNLQD